MPCEPAAPDGVTLKVAPADEEVEGREGGEGKQTVKAAKTRHHQDGSSDIEVILRGDISADARSYAQQMISELARHSHDPILHARVRLTRSADPALARPVIAQANLDVNGRTGITHAHARGSSSTPPLPRSGTARSDIDDHGTPPD